MMDRNTGAAHATDSPSAADQYGYDSPPHRRILIIKLGALGDFIQALGPMASIRRHHPDAEITLLTTKPFVSFGLACGYVDHVWTDTRPRWHDLKGWMSLRHKLRSGQFERVYDLQNNDRTALYLKLIGASHVEWVGAAPGASHRYDTPARTQGTALAGHIQTLAQVGIDDVVLDDLRWVAGNFAHFVQNEGLKKPYILLVPGSAPGRPEKRWPAEKYAQLARIIDGWGYQPVVIGTQAENDITQKICAIHPATLNLTGKTALFDLAVLARHAAGAIGNDTGPMHLIAPTGCPSLTLFSRHSNPMRHAPLGPQVKTHQVDDLGNLDVETVEKLVSTRWFKEPGRPE